MSKIAIIPLSILIENAPQKTIDAFKNKGVYRPLMFFHKYITRKITPIIDNFNLGRIDSTEFRRQMRACRWLIPATLTDQDFDEAWNAMCETTDYTARAFEHIRNLEKSGVKVYVFSATNVSHIQHIISQAGEIPGIHYFSFNKGLLNATSNEALLRSLIAKIYAENPGITSDDISLYFKPPQTLASGRFEKLRRCLPSILKTERQNAINYVNYRLPALANSLGFNLIPYKAESLERYHEERVETHLVQYKVDNKIPLNYSNAHKQGSEPLAFKKASV